MPSKSTPRSDMDRFGSLLSMRATTTTTTSTHLAVYICLLSISAVSSDHYNHHYSPTRSSSVSNTSTVTSDLTRHAEYSPIISSASSPTTVPTPSPSAFHSTINVQYLPLTPMLQSSPPSPSPSSFSSRLSQLDLNTKNLKIRSSEHSEVPFPAPIMSSQQHPKGEKTTRLSKPAPMINNVNIDKSSNNNNHNDSRRGRNMLSSGASRNRPFNLWQGKHATKEVNMTAMMRGERGKVGMKKKKSNMSKAMNLNLTMSHQRHQNQQGEHQQAHLLLTPSRLVTPSRARRHIVSTPQYYSSFAIPRGSSLNLHLGSEHYSSAPSHFLSDSFPFASYPSSTPFPPKSQSEPSGGLLRMHAGSAAGLSPAAETIIMTGRPAQQLEHESHLDLRQQVGKQDNNEHLLHSSLRHLRLHHNHHHRHQQTARTQPDIDAKMKKNENDHSKNHPREEGMIATTTPSMRESDARPAHLPPDSTDRLITFANNSKDDSLTSSSPIVHIHNVNTDSNTATTTTNNNNQDSIEGSEEKFDIDNNDGASLSKQKSNKVSINIGGEVSGSKSGARQCRTLVSKFESQPAIDNVHTSHGRLSNHCINDSEDDDDDEENDDGQEYEVSGRRAAPQIDQWSAFVDNNDRPIVVNNTNNNNKHQRQRRGRGRPIHDDKDDIRRTLTLPTDNRRSLYYYRSTPNHSLTSHHADLNNLTKRQIGEPYTGGTDGGWQSNGGNHQNVNNNHLQKKYDDDEEVDNVNDDEIRGQNGTNRARNSVTFGRIPVAYPVTYSVTYPPSAEESNNSSRWYPSRKYFILSHPPKTGNEDSDDERENGKAVSDQWPPTSEEATVGEQNSPRLSDSLSEPSVRESRVIRLVSRRRIPYSPYRYSHYYPRRRRMDSPHTHHHHSTYSSTPSQYEESLPVSYLLPVRSKSRRFATADSDESLPASSSILERFHSSLPVRYSYSSFSSFSPHSHFRSPSVWSSSPYFPSSSSEFEFGKLSSKISRRHAAVSRYAISNGHWLSSGFAAGILIGAIPFGIMMASMMPTMLTGTMPIVATGSPKEITSRGLALGSKLFKQPIFQQLKEQLKHFEMQQLHGVGGGRSTNAEKNNGKSSVKRQKRQALAATTTLLKRLIHHSNAEHNSHKEGDRRRSETSNIVNHQSLASRKDSSAVAVTSAVSAIRILFNQIQYFIRDWWAEARRRSDTSSPAGSLSNNLLYEGSGDGDDAADNGDENSIESEQEGSDSLEASLNYLLSSLNNPEVCLRALLCRLMASPPDAADTNKSNNNIIDRFVNNAYLWSK